MAHLWTIQQLCRLTRELPGKTPARRDRHGPKRRAVELIAIGISHDVTR
jgi:hypothetical protein